MQRAVNALYARCLHMHPRGNKNVFFRGLMLNIYCMGRGGCVNRFNRVVTADGLHTKPQYLLLLHTYIYIVC
jgi:hypothetical protein